MFASSPEHIVQMMDKAFNEGDFNSLLGFYEDAAVVVTEPTKLARGKQQLRLFLEHVMSSNHTARQLKTHVIEADGIALFLSRWTLATSGEVPEEVRCHHRISQAAERRMESPYRQPTRTLGAWS